jgi:hypothetical protein
MAKIMMPRGADGLINLGELIYKKHKADGNDSVLNALDPRHSKRYMKSQGTNTKRLFR